jgi:ketosteroid isomerase-like protein
MRMNFMTALVAIALGSAISYTAPAKNQSEPPKLQSSTQQHDAVADVDAIRSLITMYAKSVDDSDTNLASQVWWDSPEVSFIHPLGYEHGFEQIKRNVYEHLMGEMFSERKLTFHDIAIHVYGEAAWAEYNWDFLAKLRKDGQPITTHGRETQIYRKFPTGWRLVHVHYSPMPASQPGQGF